MDRVVCILNGYTVRVDGSEFGRLEYQTLGGRDALEATAREWEERGFRRVTPDYYTRREFRSALQGVE